ncbi:hypothetical protein FD755_023347 [Muntiacus reevesi]|uniref:Uncharacterized protein n=1 Tax=Muntiacus reevesi TaxID=9886 RepID=A0A5N3VXM9_MUNRE|nr:hypothetical protein FD755_023348 [Muntiacus reevesi]KAB0353959.1 hypothetical protein FD755_023347 [Muntiacus reevesi]
MPGPAVDAEKVPFRSAKEEIRAGVGVEGSEGGGGGGPERPGARGHRQDIVWRNVFLMSLLHLAAVYSLVLIPKAQPLTLLWARRGEAGGAGAREIAGRRWLRAVRSSRVSRCSVRESSGRSEHLKYCLTCPELHRPTGSTCYSHSPPGFGLPPGATRTRPPLQLCQVTSALSRPLMVVETESLLLRLPGEVNTLQEPGIHLMGDAARPILLPPCRVFCFSYFSSVPFPES